LEELKELFEFLDDIIPEDEEEDDVPKKRAVKKRQVPLRISFYTADALGSMNRRSESVASDNSSVISRRKGNNTKSRSKWGHFFPSMNPLFTSDTQETPVVEI
jgi:condensin complex subunit 3